MKTHLTDTDIQNLLDGNPVAQAGEMKRHLAECAVCRKSYQAYQMLIPVLSDEISLPFGADFTNNLLARIPVAESQKKIPTWTIVAGSVLAMGGIGYGLKILLPKISKGIPTFHTVFEEIQATGSSFSAFFSRNFGSPTLIAAAFAAIALVMLMDKFFIQPRLNPAKTH